MRDRYLSLIDQIIEITLKGQIRSKEQVYQMLVQEIEPGTGEIFERTLAERLTEVQQQIDNNIQVSTASRRQRALNTIEGEWKKWQKANQVSANITTAITRILQNESDQRIVVFARIIDPNRPQPLNIDSLQQLAKALLQAPTGGDSELQDDLQQLSMGITRGLAAWQRLEGNLVSWMYESSRGQIGFTGSPESAGPWSLWAKLVNSPIPQGLFQTIANQESLVELAAQPTGTDITGWVELAVVLQCLQRGLIQFFDQRIYSAKLGASLSISTFLTFAVIWSQLALGFNQGNAGRPYGDGCFQMTLQILRTFSGREYFPLYGGFFAYFGGRYLKDALSYLDEPLKQAEGTQEKARILTLLGASRRTQGDYLAAQEFHREALEISRQASDRICEVANYNHLARLYVSQKNYSEAINYSQRALILSRQSGDKLGEANALANLGYSEVFQAKQLEQAEPEVYEMAVNYLEQGAILSERLGDRLSSALALSSLGIARVLLGQNQDAIADLEQSFQAAQFAGDLYLQGLSLAYLAEAYNSLGNVALAIYAGSLGMYQLEQIGAVEWRQIAGLLAILEGQLGAESFREILQQNRPKIIAVIGVDGYDYLPELLTQYRQG